MTDMADPTHGCETTLSSSRQLLLDQLSALAPGGSADFPVSSGQRRLWLLHQLAPDSPNYAMPTALRLRGRLDIDALRRSVDALVARHEALRTTFPAADGTPWARVHAEASVSLDVRPGRCDQSGDGPVPALLDEAARPFDLSAGPLVRVVVWRLGAQDHVLLLVVHHIVADGWSVELLVRDLTAAYRACCAGDSPSFAPLTVQQADFAVWETNRDATADLEPGLSYWCRELSERADPLALPVRGPRPDGMSGPAHTVWTRVDGALRGQVRAAARSAATTEFAVLFTAFVALLSRLTGQRDLIVGTPVSGRQRRELADVVGYFVNTLPIRFRWDEDTTSEGLLEHVRTTLTSAFEHQDVPLDAVVDRVETVRRSDRNPLYDVIFTVQDELCFADAFPGIDARSIQLDPAAAKVDLTCVVTRSPEHLDVQWSYRADLLDLADMRAVAQSFAPLLGSLLAAADRQLADLDVDDALAAPRGRPQPGPAVEPPAAGGASEPGPDGPAAAGAPVTGVEAVIVDVWAELLGRPAGAITRADDFFALGGQSFLAARAAARLSKRLDRHVDVRDVFAHPTVAALATMLAAATATRPIERRPRAAATGALSHSQEQVFFLEQLAPESPAYNIPLIVRLTGRLDVAALHSAVRWVVGRHEALRTCFEIHAGEPRQRVQADADVKWLERDLRGMPDALGAATETANQQGFRRFTAADGPPVRVAVLRVADDVHLVTMTVHHLVADGASVRVICRDLRTAYIAYAEGGEPAQAPPPLRFLDYADWERGRSDAELADGLAFWRAALDGAPQTLDLPSRRHCAGPRGRGASVPVEVGAATAERLDDLAAATGCTRYMVLVAALAVVLSRYSGQRELLLGTPAANRTHPDTSELVGPLVNTVVLRADLRGRPTVGELLARVRRMCTAAFAHQDVPFESVVESVASQREPSRSPLFQVMLAVNDAPYGDLDLPGLSCVPVYPDNPTAKFELLLNIADDGESVRGFCEYDLDVYDGVLVESMMTHVARVLDEFVADPDRRLSEIGLLVGPQRAALLEAAAGPPAGYDSEVCLHRLVEAVVDRQPGAMAVLDDGADRPGLTYAELDAAANLTAGTLRHAGVRRGDTVGVLAPRSLALVVGEYAALKAGAAFLPLDPAWPPARLSAVIGDAGCRTVLTGEIDVAGLQAATLAIPVDDAIARARASAGPVARPVVPTSAQDVAYVVYTSGSTGRPKGVQVEHGAISNNLLWMQQDWPLGPADRLLQKATATFDVAVKEIFWPLLAGAAVVLARPGVERDPAAILDAIGRHRVTIAHLVPSMLDVCLQSAEGRDAGLGPSLRYVMCGAEELRPDTRARFAAAGHADLLHMYGPTETAVAVTGWTCRREDPATDRVPLGRPMPNCRLYVLDDDLNPTPPLVWGELYVSGRPLARGYLGRSAETAEVFLPDPYAPDPGRRMYRTGDVVRHGSRGLLEFRGRADGQVKIRGLRVELGEVESALRAHPAVQEAAVVLHRGNDALDTLAGFAVLRTGTPDPGGQLRRHLAATLPEYMVPSQITVLDAMPITEHGKLDRAALSAVPLSRPASGHFVAARDPIEQVVAGVWSSVLGIAPIGVEDDFFALGGHSLQAARIVTRLREHFDRDVPMRTMFAEPTVAALAALLRSPSGSGELPRIPRRAARRAAADPPSPLDGRDP
jgi:amino acid adenylation domain-containing protein